MKLVREIVKIYRNYDFTTEVLAASITYPRHVTEAALAGAHIATVPLKVLRQMIQHPLTDSGTLQFRRDWAAAQAANAANATRAAKDATSANDGAKAGVMVAARSS